MQKKNIAFLIPSLQPGGAERVMSILANNFSQRKDVNVHLILYLSPHIFYYLDRNVVIHKVNFNYKKYPKLISFLLVLFFIRGKLRTIQPYAFLSFEGRYNFLVLLASIGLSVKRFVSDRSRPGIKYGFLPDLLNPYLYRISDGIVAQTKFARDYVYSLTKHQNIKVIPNPIVYINKNITNRENIILNVGRFISSKNQSELIQIFKEVNPQGWKLILIGEGPNLLKCKKIASQNGLEDRVQFIGNTQDIHKYYQRSKIFAFTSLSEGFPNALGEAMASGCACISYNCIAGPSDLIDDGKNGFLVPLHDKDFFKNRLNQMMQPEFNRNKMGLAAIESTKQYSEEVIARKTLNFILNNGN